MIASHTDYNADKPRPNKRIAFDYCLGEIKFHSGKVVAFPGSQATDIKQLLEAKKLSADASFTLFEDGSYARANIKSGVKRKKCVVERLRKVMSQVLYNGKRDFNGEVVYKRDKNVTLPENTFDAGFNDFCHSASCFEKWWIKKHLNAYKIGADLTFTISLCDRGESTHVGEIVNKQGESNAHIYEINNSMTESKSAETIARKVLSYVSNWMKVGRAAIYKDLDNKGKGQMMLCFHAVVERHFDCNNDCDLVK